MRYVTPEEVASAARARRWRARLALALWYIITLSAFALIGVILALRG